MTTFCAAVRDFVFNILAVAVQIMCLPLSKWNCFTSFMDSYCWICSMAKKTLVPRVVAITGANSGIGEGLAYTYSKDNCALILLARNLERLEKVKENCEQLGAINVKIVQIDVTDTKTLKTYLEEKTIEYNIDLFIANAGVAVIEDQSILDQSETILQTNVLGTIVSMNAVFKAYKRRGRGGQIACMASIFGLMDPPELLNYGASKAAILSYCRDFRTLGKEYGITVNTIVPGFIKTPMTARINASRGLFLTPEVFAEKVKHDLANDVGLIAAPVYQYLIFALLGTLPPAIKQCVSDRIYQLFGNGPLPKMKLA